MLTFRVGWLWWHSSSTVAFWQSLNIPGIIWQGMHTHHHMPHTPPHKVRGILTKPSHSLISKLTVPLEKIVLINILLRHTSEHIFNSTNYAVTVCLDLILWCLVSWTILASTSDTFPLKKENIFSLESLNSAQAKCPAFHTAVYDCFSQHHHFFTLPCFYS